MTEINLRAAQDHTTLSALGIGCREEGRNPYENGSGI
jgi:hypothetical protein